MEVKRIIITGASGYLGQHLLHSILSSEPPRDNLCYEVWALYKSHSTFENDVCNSILTTSTSDESATMNGESGEAPYPKRACTLTNGRPKPLPDRVKLNFAKLDITNGDDVRKTVQSIKPHLCIHLAAFSSPALAERKPKVTHALNCPTVLFDTLAELKAEIVALSSDQVYDGMKKKRVMDQSNATPTMNGSGPRTATETPQQENHKNPHLYVETDVTKPVNVYGQTKLIMEQMLQTKFPTTSVILRSSIIFGPEAPYGNCKTTFLHFIRSRINVETTYWVDECRTVISVFDIVCALEWFMEHGVCSEHHNVAGVYNMGGRDRVSRYEMAMAVTRRFDGEECYIKGPQKALKTKLPGSVTHPLDISMDSSKLENIVGMKMKGFDEILTETFPETKYCEK